MLGFGKPPRERVTQLDPETQRYGLGYFETLDMIATMLGTELDSKEAFVEPAVLTRDLNLGWVDYAAGTVGGQRRTYRGYRGGRPVIELAICWTMSDDALEPKWSDPKGFSVVIEGEPRVDATIRFGNPGRGRDDRVDGQHRRRGGQRHTVRLRARSRASSPRLTCLSPDPQEP